MEIKGHLRYLRIAPRKVRLIANLIRGMDVDKAELELKHFARRPAEPLLKLLKSAVANAKHNFQLGEGLYVKQVLVDEGPPLKRFRARAFGRAAPIKKRTSHISITLDTRGKDVAPRRKKKEGPRVRDITEEDIMIEGTIKPRGEKAAEKEAPKSRETGFVRRVFRRKAI